MKQSISNITAVSIGPSKTLETLRTALAMGVDSAIHVEIPESLSPEPLGIAKALKAVIEREAGKEQVDLVIMGKQAIDDDAGQTGQMLAGLLNWAQATYASKVVISDDEREVNVTREVDGGAEELQCRLPAVVTTDLRYVFCHFL
jgi:electron transfer flavoprotein beta subunit